MQNAVLSSAVPASSALCTPAPRSRVLSRSGLLAVLLCGLLLAPAALFAGPAARKNAVHKSAASSAFERLLTRAREEYKSADAGSALRDYAAALNLQPRAFEPRAELARIYGEQGVELKKEGEASAAADLQRALQYARELVSMFPQNAEAWYLKGMADGNLAKISSGIEKLQLARKVEEDGSKAIQLKSDYAPAYALLGILDLELSRVSFMERTMASAAGGLPPGNAQDAVNMLQKAVQLDPGFIYARYKLAEALLATHNKSAARQQLFALLQLPPRSGFERDTQNDARAKLQGLS